MGTLQTPDERDELSWTSGKRETLAFLACDLLCLCVGEWEIRPQHENILLRPGEL